MYHHHQVTCVSQFFAPFLGLPSHAKTFASRLLSFHLSLTIVPPRKPCSLFRERYTCCWVQHSRKSERKSLFLCQLTVRGRSCTCIQTSIGLTCGLTKISRDRLQTRKFKQRHSVQDSHTLTNRHTLLQHVRSCVIIMPRPLTNSLMYTIQSMCTIIICTHYYDRPSAIFRSN